MKLTITKLKADFLLILVTIVWGLGFVFVKLALDAGVPSGFMNVVRGLIFAFLIFLFFGKNVFKAKIPELKIALFAGVLNAFAFVLQTQAMKFTTPSNNSFLTVTYVVMVPVLMWLFYKKRPKINVFISIVLSVIGMVILTGVGISGFSLNLGDLLTIICALFYALSIIVVGRNAKDIHFSVVAFYFGITQAVIGFLYFIIFDKFSSFSAIQWGSAILPMLAMGIICSFGGQTLQVFAQKHTSPTRASIIMTFEGLFGAIFSVLWGLEKLTSQLFVGGLVILFALIILEINFKSKKSS